MFQRGAEMGWDGNSIKRERRLLIERPGEEMKGKPKRILARAYLCPHGALAIHSQNYNSLTPLLALLDSMYSPHQDPLNSLYGLPRAAKNPIWPHGEILRVLLD